MTYRMLPLASLMVNRANDRHGELENETAAIGLMVKNNRLAPILNQYKELSLGPDQLSGLEMGHVYEELLRRFSEQSGRRRGSTSPRAK